MQKYAIQYEYLPNKEFNLSRTLSSANEISSAKKKCPPFIASIRGPSTHSNNRPGEPSWKYKNYINN